MGSRPELVSGRQISLIAEQRQTDRQTVTQVARTNDDNLGRPRRRPRAALIVAPLDTPLQMETSPRGHGGATTIGQRNTVSDAH